jgi:hypothetical protein
MNQPILDIEQSDLEIFSSDVSDEALEACAAEGGGRLTYSLQFYTCGVDACP